MRGGSDCIPDCSTRWSRGGAEAIEIFAARGHFNYSDRQHVREIANWFRSTGIAFHSMHAPMHGDDEWGRSGAPPLNIAAVEKRDRIAAMDEIKRAIEVAEQAPFQFLVQHVGVGRETSTEQKLESAMTSLEHLRAFAKPLGVQIVVENIPNDLSTPEKPGGVAAHRALHRCRSVLRRGTRAHGAGDSAGLRDAEDR